MRKFLLLAAAAGVLQAANIRGNVVENQTGRPLSRVVVAIQPLSGTPGAARTARTDSHGVFDFPPVAGGAYLVSAARRGFAPLQYGQKHWKASGMPVFVEESGALFLTLRLPRFGAISGTVLDENDVGLPEHDVAVYRNTRPPQLVAKATTDDRGVYRATGLEPGMYLVRTFSKQYPDGGYVPTFWRQATRLDQAYPVEADLDRETENVAIRAEPGRLFAISGVVGRGPWGAAVTVTLASDTGRESMTTSDPFGFNPAAPGEYELYASAETRTGVMSAYMPLVLDRDRPDLRLSLNSTPATGIQYEDERGLAVDARAFRLLARRKDMAGVAETQTLPPGARAPLTLGRWEVMLEPTPGYYVARFSGPRFEPVGRGRPDGWNEIQPDGMTPIRFVLSDSPGGVHGTVAGEEKAVGAPVFLEPHDPDGRRRLMEPRSVRTDTRGQYQFSGLAPGAYRIVSTFEYRMPDAADMERAGAKVIQVEKGKDMALDLELYVSR